MKPKIKKWFISANRKKQSILPTNLFILFIKKLALMLSSDISLIESVRLLSLVPSHPTLEALLFTLNQDLKQGIELSTSLKKHPSIFDQFSCSLIAIGEQSGTLSSALMRLIQYQEAIKTLKNKIKKALYYPLITVGISCLVTLGLFVFVIPTFEAIFSQYQAELPLLTKMIFKLSYFIKNYSLLLILSCAICYLILKHYYQADLTWRYHIESWIFRIPFLGDILHKIIQAHTIQTLSITYQSGLPLFQGLAMTIHTTKNIHYAKMIIQIKSDVGNGHALYVAIKKTKLLPEFLSSLIHIGEISGKLNTMLDNIVSLLEEEINTTISDSLIALEPILMLAIGAMVGTLVIAMYLPLFKLGQLF